MLHSQASEGDLAVKWLLSDELLIEQAQTRAVYQRKSFERGSVLH